jgi:hypothetical protein
MWRAAALCLLLLAAGCGQADDRDQVRETVERFYSALGDGRPEAACDELGEAALEQLESQSGQPCEGVIARLPFEGGDITNTEVWITNAKVDLQGGESAFLSRERDGWKLSAIACMPEKGKPADRPLECEVES